MTPKVDYGLVSRVAEGDVVVKLPEKVGGVQLSFEDTQANRSLILALLEERNRLGRGKEDTTMSVKPDEKGDVHRDDNNQVLGDGFFTRLTFWNIVHFKTRG